MPVPFWKAGSRNKGRAARAFHPGCFASTVRKRLKNKEIAELHDPRMRKRIEVKDLAIFLDGGQEDGGMPEGLQEAAR